MLEVKVVLSNSPSLPPKPVKSNNNTAIPFEVNPRLMCFMANKFLEQVKQCAKMAKALGF